jgi:hypothetical protein
MGHLTLCPHSPSKSKATIRASLVGLTDIQTPSVVHFADPANEVPTRWLSAKLFPIDCSPALKSDQRKSSHTDITDLPMDDTTLTG